MQEANNQEAAADARARKGGTIRINGIDLTDQDLRREFADSVEHISDLDIENEKLRNEIKRLKESRSELENENKALRNTSEAGPEQFMKLREENRRLSGNNSRLDEMVADLSRERADLLSMIPTGGNPYSSERTDLWRNQRVAVLVDVQNMYYSAKNIYNSKISFHKLLPALIKNRKLVRAIAYTVEKEGSDQQKFYEVLRRSGFEIKSRDLIIRSDGSRKGDWDMGIAIDAISLAEKADVIALVTGDGDFVALVNMLKGRGVRVEVASFKESTADNLLAAADEHFSIDNRMLAD